MYKKMECEQYIFLGIEQSWLFMVNSIYYDSS